MLQEDPDPNLFATEVRNCAGSSVTFDIWSAKVYPLYLICECAVAKRNTGPTNTHRLDPHLPREPLPRSRIAASSSLLDPTHMARTLDSVSAQSGIPRRIASPFRLHHRNAQRHITRRVGTRGISRGPPRPNTRAVGVQ